MKCSRYIWREGREYPLNQMEASDLTEHFKSRCRGFVHGGKLSYLPKILQAGELKCSDTLRSEGGTQIRDACSRGPDGAGVYFRFVPRRKRNADTDILTTRGGVGSSGGMQFFLPLERAVGREFITMSSLDVKYGIRNPCARDLEAIGEHIVSPGVNQTEIGFWGGVRLIDIPAIYIQNEVLHSQYPQRKSADTGMTRDELLQMLENSGFQEEETNVNGWRKFGNSRMLPYNPANSYYQKVPGHRICPVRAPQGKAAPLPPLPPLKMPPPQMPLRGKTVLGQKTIPVKIPAVSRKKPLR